MRGLQTGPERSVRSITLEAVSEKSIEEIAREAIPHIAVLGIGGAGCNIVSWMKEKEVSGARIYALNSDAKRLSITKADERVLLGYEVTGGLGCGGFPEQGSKAAEESADEIQKLIAGAGLVFITAGLGGGTGTGASPAIAKIAKEMGALTLSVVTIPFQVERARLVKAKEGLTRLVAECDAVIVIDNNRLRKVAGNLPLSEAFGVTNELIAAFIKNISETIAIPSLVNLDFADLKAILTGSGVCAIGIGEGRGDNKVEDAVEEAFGTLLLDVGDLKKCEAALVHIEGGDDMTLEDVNRAGEIVLNRIAESARTSWGARVNSRLEGAIHVTLVLAGVESPFLLREIVPFGLVTEPVSGEISQSEESYAFRTLKQLGLSDAKANELINSLLGQIGQQAESSWGVPANEKTRRMLIDSVYILTDSILTELSKTREREGE